MRMKQTWSSIKIFKMTRFSLINDKTSKAATVLHNFQTCERKDKMYFIKRQPNSKQRKPDWVALQTEETTTCDAAHRFHDVSLRSPCVCSFVRRIECEVCRQIDTRHFYYPAATSTICHIGRVLYSTISTRTKFYFLVLLLLALLDLCYFC